MSDVEKQIEQWRSALAGSELLRRVPISTNWKATCARRWNALEDARDLSGDGDVSRSRCRRLGDTAALETEFAKVNATDG